MFTAKYFLEEQLSIAKLNPDNGQIYHIFEFLNRKLQSTNHLVLSYQIYSFHMLKSIN